MKVNSLIVNMILAVDIALNKMMTFFGGRAPEVSALFSPFTDRLDVPCIFHITFFYL